MLVMLAKYSALTVYSCEWVSLQGAARSAYIVNYLLYPLYPLMSRYPSVPSING